MRKPKGLSHSAITLWDENRMEFFLRYLADNRPPRFPQTRAMAVGSGFDAIVKHVLAERFYGPTAGTQFELQTIFHSQVDSDPHGDTWGDSVHTFLDYRASGALGRLIDWIDSGSDLKMELKVMKRVNGVPFVGLPDVWFRDFTGTPVVFDFKVKGYCGRGNTSPTKNYMWCEDAPGWPKPSKSNKTAHKNFNPLDLAGLVINATPMEDSRAVYAAQCSIYGWLMGEDVGGTFITAIDEVCVKAATPLPLIRVASHRAVVTPKFQWELMTKAQDIWSCCQTGFIFTDMSRRDNDKRCVALNDTATELATATGEDEFFNSITRQQRFAP